MNAPPAECPIRIGGVAATVVDRTSEVLTILTPAHAAGVADVHVDNGNGTGATWTAGFTFEPDQFVRYFAEGASGAFFQTRFALANPHAEAVPVTVTFTDTLGGATTMAVVVPAQARLTIDERNRGRELHEDRAMQQEPKRSEIKRHGTIQVRFRDLRVLCNCMS